MKRVTLIRALQPDKKIQAIKNLREATRPPQGTPGSPMGLKEAKDIADALIANGTPAEVEVYETQPLLESFDFTVDAAKLNRTDVLDFVLDVLSVSEPHVASQIMTMPSYRRVAEALR
jgi:hypothetical protein